ncbi:hypothetical protein B0H13DRAFT_1911353 [Mycena leptocephala]|nr:hypothetical protein B0H13DRAFT_1911353 [Mycena leptocephala]
MNLATSVPGVVPGVDRVKEEFANGFIGFALSTAAYGIGVLQTYLYYHNYPKDRGILKTMVGMLWCAYYRRSFPAENVALTLVTIITQWCGDIHWLRITTTLPLASMRGKFGQDWASVIGGPVQGTACVCDIVITVALIYYLRSRGSEGIRAPRDMIYTLIIYVMCRGIATAFTQLMFLIMARYILLQKIEILFILPSECRHHTRSDVFLTSTNSWMPFHLLMSKVYVNSVLASLNARNTVREKDESRSVALSNSLVFNVTANMATSNLATSDMATSDTAAQDSYPDTRADHSARHNDGLLAECHNDNAPQTVYHRATEPWSQKSLFCLTFEHAHSRCEGLNVSDHRIKVAWQKQMTEDEGEGAEFLAAEYSDEEPDVGLLRVPMTTLKSK